jgi:hypothetical protein
MAALVAIHSYRITAKTWTHGTCESTPFFERLWAGMKRDSCFAD